MELTGRQIASLQKAAVFTNLQTLFFVALLSEKHIEEKFDDVVNAIEERDCKALADCIFNPSVQAQEQTVDIFKMIEPKKRAPVLSLQNSEGNTALHLICNDEIDFQLLTILAPEERVPAVSFLNEGGQTPLDLMKENCRAKTVAMLWSTFHEEPEAKIKPDDFTRLMFRSAPQKETEAPRRAVLHSDIVAKAISVNAFALKGEHTRG